MTLCMTSCQSRSPPQYCVRLRLICSRSLFNVRTLTEPDALSQGGGGLDKGVTPTVSTGTTVPFTIQNTHRLRTDNVLGGYFPSNPHTRWKHQPAHFTEPVWHPPHEPPTIFLLPDVARALACHCGRALLPALLFAVPHPAGVPLRVRTACLPVCSATGSPGSRRPKSTLPGPHWERPVAAAKAASAPAPRTAKPPRHTVAHQRARGFGQTPGPEVRWPGGGGRGSRLRGGVQGRADTCPQRSSWFVERFGKVVRRDPLVG